MNLTLVAMPWPHFDTPSAALGALAAFVRAHAPGWEARTRHAYLDVADAIGAIYHPLSVDPEMGELVYATLLYPERVEAVRARFGRWLATEARRVPADLGDPDALFDHVRRTLEDHAERLATELAAEADVVGFTTSYCQLFPSLAVARRLKALAPGVRVVLGGAAVLGEAGPSLLAEYPFVDAIVQGEGELRLVRLLAALGGDDVEAALDALDVSGVRVRGRPAPKGCGSGLDVADLDTLPIPDYDEYAEQAEARSIQWELPIEGSRGCWWDRVEKTGDPTQICFFCSLNNGRFRRKAPARIGRECDALARRHRNVRLRFLDNILAARAGDALATALEATGRNFRFFHELRAQVTPFELLRLWEAGCRAVQVGIEGLSTPYLHRIGKGTTTIQNLQAMRTLYELGIDSGSNLIVGFPGATAEEVAETVDTIRRAACAWQPTSLSRFSLGVDSTVFRVPARFGVSEIRNAAAWADALPAEVNARLRLHRLDFDGPALVDWEPVRRAVADWNTLHQRLAAHPALPGGPGIRPLHYLDGGDFLEIVDHRSGYRLVTLDADWREVYLHCMEIRARAAVIERFAPRFGAEAVEEMLQAFVAEDLLYAEGGRVLALAVADAPHVAAARIRAAAGEEGGRMTG